MNNFLLTISTSVMARTQENLDVINKIDQFYNNAWNKMVLLVSGAFFVIGFLMPLFLQWYRDKKWKILEEKIEQKTKELKELEECIDKKEEKIQSLERQVEDNLKNNNKLFDSIIDMMKSFQESESATNKRINEFYEKLADQKEEFHKNINVAE